MIGRKKILVIFAVVVAFASSVTGAAAQGNEYDAVVKHLKNSYQARKVNIPFMWLARMAVGIARPAGVKSFKVTVFENLKFSRETLDEEMQAALAKALGSEWSPILRVRSREGEQVYMYMRETGPSVKMMLVTIDRTEAVVVRARFSPEKLARFIEDPRIFGISLNGGTPQTREVNSASNGTEIMPE